MKPLPNNKHIDEKLFKIFKGNIIRLTDCDKKYKHGYIKVKCIKCNNEWTPRIDYLCKKGCKYCTGYALTDETFDTRIYKFFKDQYIRISNIIIGHDVNKKVLMHCKKCNSKHLQRTYHVLDGHGCKYCNSIRSNEQQRLLKSEIIKRSKQINGKKYNYSKMQQPKNQRDKICLICKVHGEFLQTVSDHLYNKSGCPKCKESKGEKAIRIFLENNNIKYIRNKSFDGCKHKRLLYFDFYLPDYSILIEYDGEQHISGWRYNNKTHSVNKNILKSITDIKIRDNIKNEFCKSNNIPLLRICYKNYDNISSILKNYLCF